MKSSKCLMPGVFGLAGIAVGVGACTEGPVAPEQPQQSESPAAAVSAAGRVDRYVVLLKEGIAGGTAVNALSASAVKLGGTIERAHNGIGVLQVRGLSAAAAAQLSSQAGVEAVAQDRRVRWLPPKEQRRGTKVLPESNQRGAAFFDQYQWNMRKIQAPRAWNTTPQGAGVTVCILDTGVDPRQIDLEGKLRTDISASFVATERADRDLDTHGTAMGAIVTSNGIGVASVAPDAKLCSVKVLDRTGSGTFGDVAAGIMYVGDAGRLDGSPRVDVANMSLGVLISRDDPELQTLTTVLQRAVNYSTNRGVLFVASAGNQDANLNNPNIVHLPSDLNGVISVGATGPINQERFNHIASYSNVGREGVDIFAPGGEFAFADNVLEDLILTACSPSTRIPGFEVCADEETYVFLAGTSPAAAHVSGAAAVIESELPGNQTPAELTECLLESAVPLRNPSLTANGRLNVFEASVCGSSNVASR